jgi:IS30 family transposase
MSNRKAKGGVVKPFTLEDRLVIQKLLKMDKTGGEIALELGRSKTGVNFEVRNHGGRDNYDAVKANKMAIDAQQDRIEKLRDKERRKRGISFMDRIAALEMQMSILNETIKEMIRK